MASKRQDALRRFLCPCPLVRPESPRTHRKAVPASSSRLRLRSAQKASSSALRPCLRYSGKGKPCGRGGTPRAAVATKFSKRRVNAGSVVMRQGRVKTSIVRRPFGRGIATAPALGWPKQHARRHGSLRRFGKPDAVGGAGRGRKEMPEAGGREGPFPHPVGGAGPFPADGGQPFPQEGEGGVQWGSTT